MAEIEIRAFQGQGATFTATINRSGFAGTETLTASVYRGDTQAALLTITPVWNTGTDQTTPPRLVDFPFTGPQLSALAPGAYAILLGLADNTAAFAKGILEVYPAPGGTPPPFERSLASVARAQSMLPELRQDQIDYLPSALRAATRAIETYCGGPWVLTTYDKIIRPKAGLPQVRLNTRKAVDVQRVAVDVVCGCLVSNASVGIGAASLQATIAAPGSLQVKSLAFKVTTNGAVASQSLALANYATFNDLAAGINGLGNGWAATAGSGRVGTIACTEAFGTPTARSVLDGPIWVHTHSDPLGWQWVNPEQGIVEINEPIPGGFLVPNPRVERSDSRYWGIRFTWRAGYAVQQADIDLGYEPVPDDLQDATIMTAKAVIEAGPMAGPVKSQTVKDRSYVLKDMHAVIPDAAKDILAGYQYAIF